VKDLARDRLEGGAIVDGRLDGQDLLPQRVDADEADHLGVEGLPAM
jgi:hypothetical protein